DPANIQSRVELDMRYGNQLTQIGVVCPFEQLASQREVLTLLDLFSDLYAHRYGKGSQAPEAGVRINVIRVVSYVERDKVELKPSTAQRRPVSSGATLRECHYLNIDGPVKTNVYNS